MSMSISIPHQRVIFESGTEGTVRGILSTSIDGHAHGHVAFASKDCTRRYRALTGSFLSCDDISIQLEQILLGAGVIELASLDVHVLSTRSESGLGADADIVLRSVPDAHELLRATILLDIQN